MKITAWSDQVIIEMIQMGSARSRVMEWLFSFYADLNGIEDPEMEDILICEKYADRLYALVASNEPIEWAFDELPSEAPDDTTCTDFYDGYPVFWSEDDN